MLSGRTTGPVAVGDVPPEAAKGGVPELGNPDSGALGQSSPPGIMGAAVGSAAW